MNEKESDSDGEGEGGERDALDSLSTLEGKI